MFCHKCGTENLNSARFCKNCGANIGSQIIKEQLLNTRNATIKRKKLILLISAILFIFTSIVGFVVYINSRNNIPVDALADLEVKELTFPSLQWKPTGLTGSDLVSVRITRDKETGEDGLQLQFGKEGIQKMLEISKRNIGRSMEIYLDNEVIGSVSVSAEITDGVVELTGFSINNGIKKSKWGNFIKDQNEAKTAEDLETEKTTLVSLNDEWNRYTNSDMGFSIDIPKKTFSGSGACTAPTKDDDSYRQEMAMVPIKIFNSENNSIYIAQEYFYKLDGQKNERHGTTFSKCDKYNTSLREIEDKDNSSEIDQWNIKSEDINNDQELEKFIKTTYGSTCEIKSKTEASQEGVYDIRIEGDGKDPDETSCNISYVFNIKYNPSMHRVIYWGIGHSYNFSDSLDKAYDEKMTISFKFLN